MASTDVPVKYRQMAEGENHLRPHLIHLNRCENVQLDGFKIRESPFWTVHLYMCKNGRVSNLDVYAHGHNNDGVDLEMTQNFVIEDCVFDQGDDAVVIKAGRNQDAWRLATPTQNIVIRNCVIKKGHCLLGIGSEISGGIRNVYMHDCESPDEVIRLFYMKTNIRRGGFLENISMENVKANRMRRTFEIDTDVLYQWKDIVPTYEERPTRICNISMRNIECEQANAIYDIKGSALLPIDTVRLENIHVKEVNEFINNQTNVRNLSTDNITYDKFVKKEIKPLGW
jgi:polygalacturonase